MINILNELVEYLGPKVSLIPGESIFYNEMPPETSYGALIKEPVQGGFVPPQIDASVHNIQVSTKAKTSTEAYNLAMECYKWLTIDTESAESTGIIVLHDTLAMAVELHGTPIWDKTDQQGRRYYYFLATIITKNLI